MNSKITNTKIAGLGLTLLMIGPGPAWAGAVTIDMKNAYSISDSNGNTTITCNPPGSSAPTPTPAPVQPLAAPSCTLTASPATIRAGASSTLTANCTPAATSYIWNGPGMSGLSTGTSTGNVNPTSTATYSVKGINAAGSSNPAILTLTVSPSIPVSTVPSNCRIVDVTWKSGLDMRPNSATPEQYLPGDQMVAFRMKVPANLDPSRAGTNYSEDASKDMSISTSACDFSPGLLANNCMSKGEPDALVFYNSGKKMRYSCLMPPAGTVIYFNIKNGAAGRVGVPDSCPTNSDCKFRFYW